MTPPSPPRGGDYRRQGRMARRDAYDPRLRRYLLCRGCGYSRPWPGWPTCPTCGRVLVAVDISRATLDPLPEPGPGRPKSRPPAPGQPRLFA